MNAGAFVSAWSRADVDPAGIIKRHDVILGGGDHLPHAEPLIRSYDFGFVGRLLPHKGPHVALAALPAGTSMILAGQARDADYLQELQQLAKGKDVTFVEDASDAFVASLLKSVRYLLVPSVARYLDQVYSRPELLGLVALEALAAGTPVIGSDVGGLGEVLYAARQIAVEPGNVEAWRERLYEALSNPRAALDRSSFTWDAVAARCEALYAALPGAKRVGHG